jgi:dCTP diphosphatase
MALGRGIPEMSTTDRLAELQARLRTFVDDREWSQFHDPKNLAMAVASESGELLSEFRWISSSAADKHIDDLEVRARVGDEIADVAITLLLLSDRCRIDLLDAIARKLDANEQRYPVAQSKGRAERPLFAAKRPD